MMRANLEDNRIWGGRVDSRFKWGTANITPLTGHVIDANAPALMFMAPAGAINVRLPTSTEARRGLSFIFCNLSANVVTFQTDGGIGFTTAITLAANGATRVVCTGSTTQVLGWVIW